MDNKKEVQFGNIEGMGATPSFDINKIRNKAAERAVKGKYNNTNSRNLGNTALYSPNNESDIPKIEQPDSVTPSPIEEKSSPASSKDDINAEIKTTNTLSNKAVQAIDDAVGKFKGNGNAADFYNTIRREYTEENLKNSFKRKIEK